MFDLNGKTALITGASGGIGGAIAKALYDAGATVALSGTRVEPLQALAASLGDRAHVLPCNLSDADSVEALPKAAITAMGSVDILVNNGATNPHFGPIYDTDLAAFQKTCDVNIRGYFYMSSHGCKLMAKNGSGSIINVASVNGVIPGLYQGIYSITKAAVISMTKAFAKECAPMKVRVNALLPGATDTKFASALVHNDAIRNALLQHVPMNRVAQPSEMAGPVLYLASEASSYTTGACINVDGGYLVV